MDQLRDRVGADATLIPAAAIEVVTYGTARERGLRITPAPDATGSATIRVTVTGVTTSVSDDFVLRVSPVPDAPVIGPIAILEITPNASTGPIPFTLADVDTSASALVVTAVSDNQLLLPNANIVLGGSGRDRTVTATPSADRSGFARITIAVSDGTTSLTRTFTVLVNTPPTIAPIPDTTVIEGRRSTTSRSRRGCRDAVRAQGDADVQLAHGRLRERLGSLDADAVAHGCTARSIIPALKP